MANKFRFSPLRSLIVAIILWVISVFTIHTTPIAVLILIISIIAGFRSSAAVRILGSVEGGKVKVSWNWTDWGGLILLILVITALFKGISPMELIKIMKSFFGK